MKEDILEQLVDDYLQSQGYFTRHNIKFRPSREHSDFQPKLDSNHSDIDVIGIHPLKKGYERVVVVSCKSWQKGFSVGFWLESLAKNKTVSGREAWQAFRELMKPKWAEALRDEVEAITGTRKFVYVLAVTALVGDKARWETHPMFAPQLAGNPMRILELSDILRRIEEMSTTTVASSQIGRVLQLMKAAQKSKKALMEAVEAQSEEES